MSSRIKEHPNIRPAGPLRDRPGQQNDMAPACSLVEGFAAGQVIADRASDADRLYDVVLDQGGEPVIPPQRHRKYQHSYDKIAANLLVLVKLAAIMLWLK